jgi:hypothetical protein
MNVDRVPFSMMHFNNKCFVSCGSLKQRGHLEVVFSPLNLARLAWSVYVSQTILDLTHALLTAYKSEPQLFQMLCI